MFNTVPTPGTVTQLKRFPDSGKVITATGQILADAATT